MAFRTIHSKLRRISLGNTLTGDSTIPKMNAPTYNQVSQPLSLANKRSSKTQEDQIILRRSICGSWRRVCNKVVEDCIGQAAAAWHTILPAFSFFGASGGVEEGLVAPLSHDYVCPFECLMNGPCNARRYTLMMLPSLKSPMSYLSYTMPY